MLAMAQRKIWYCQECDKPAEYVQVSNFRTYLRCRDHKISDISFYLDGPISRFGQYLEEYSRKVDNRDVRRYKTGLDKKAIEKKLLHEKKRLQRIGALQDD